MSLRVRTFVYRFPLAVAAVAALSLAAGTARADEDKDKKKDDSADEDPPKPKKKPKVEKSDDERTDHDRMISHIGVSWFGVSQIPMAIATPAGDINNPAINLGTPITLNAPALGIRWWINRTVGLDAGLGFSYSGGSVTTNNVKVDKLGAFGMLIHAGLPLALANGKHISLQIIPETNIGFAKASVVSPSMNNPPPNADLSGVRFDLGARIGGEVHFGFIGIPELALEGSIGAFFTYQATGVSVGAANHSDSSISLTTASFHNPWDFFASTIQARYYF